MEHILPQNADAVAHPNGSRTVEPEHTRGITPDAYSPAQVERFLRFLGHGAAGGVTEIRIVCEEPYLTLNGQKRYVGKTVSGYYDSEHLDQAARDIAPFDGKAAIYVTLNPVKPALLARAANRLQLNARHTTTDADILSREWLPLDFDPVRPAGISASQEELDAALIRRDAVAADLEAYGAQVLRGMSGNGGHLLGKMASLPNDSESAAQVKRVLEEYSELFSDDAVHVDTGVFNAARIWKLYGTTATKGDSTPERPHRRAHLDFSDNAPEPFDLGQIPIEEPQPAPNYTTSTASAASDAPGSDSSRYVSGALQRTVEKLAGTPDGQKHNALLRAAHNLGGFIHTGDITPEQVERELLAAVGSTTKTERKDLSTIRDGLKSGQAKPHDIPERTTPGPVTAQVLGADGKPSPAPRFETFTFADMAKLPRPKWLIRGLLVEGIASMLSADSGGFKTFFSLEEALCIATGHPFHGREVKQGAVVYVAAEGFWTLLERARAWAQVRGVDLPENFQILRVPVNLGDPATVQAFAAQIEAAAPVLVVLDTLSQCAVGANENDNGQMADFVRGMMALCNKIGAHVQTLHHNGKATGSFRGASSIKANIDAHITMERPENAGPDDYTVFVRSEKQRGAPFEPFALRGELVELPEVDEYGDPITTLVFEPCGDTVAPKIQKHPSSQRADKTRDALLAVFDAVEAKNGGVKIGIWKDEVEKVEPPICGDTTFWAHKKKLENEGVIEPFSQHGGSPLFRRSVTSSTSSTSSEVTRSEGQNPDAKYFKYFNNPLGVEVLEVHADGTGEAQPQQQTPGLFSHTTAPQQPGHKSSRAQSEPYAQHKGKARKDGAV